MFLNMIFLVCTVPQDLTVKWCIGLTKQYKHCADKYKQMKCWKCIIKCCFCWFLYFLRRSTKLHNPLIVWLTSPLPRYELRIQTTTELEIAPTCSRTDTHTNKHINRPPNTEYGKQVINELPVASLCNNRDGGKMSRWKFLYELYILYIH